MMDGSSAHLLASPIRVLVVGQHEEESVFRSLLLRARMMVSTSVTRLEDMKPLLLWQPDVVVATCHSSHEVQSLRHVVGPLPLVLCSFNAQEAQVVRLLDAGADDYICLPCGREETQARLRRHACRFREIGGSARWSPLWESEDRQICLQVRQHQVVVRGQALRLSPTECALLSLLMRAGGSVVDGTVLLQAVWGTPYHSELDYVRVYIRQLRRKLEADPSCPHYLKTITGIGYCFQQRCSGWYKEEG